MLLAQHKVKVQQRHYKRIVDKKKQVYLLKLFPIRLSERLILFFEFEVFNCGLQCEVLSFIFDKLFINSLLFCKL